MRVHNPSGLTLGGEPVVARIAPRVVVTPGKAVTSDQQAAIQALYANFTAQYRVSLARSHVAHHTLPDGTTVRMVSLGGEDRIYVDPAAAPSSNAIELAGYVILPRDAGHSSGWNKGTTPDSARAYLEAKHTKAVAPPPKVTLHVKLQAGPVDWRGANGVTLTYDHGGNNRYATDRWNVVFPAGTDTDSSQSGVYYMGTKINTPVGVQAAAIFSGHLVIVGQTTMYACPSPTAAILAALAAGQFLSTVSPTWTAVTISGTVASAVRASAWHFKPDGSMAAAAYAYTSFGQGTWGLTRARTEAVPMCKRYLTLSIDAGTGNVAAAISDTAFACDPIGCKGNGVLQNGVWSGAAGTTYALSLVGRRLWGVDWDKDGNELVITFDRTGSGTYTIGGSGVSDVRQWTSHWSVNVNGAEVVRASYAIDATDAALASPCTGEWLAIHALDARSKAAVVERLKTSVAAGAYTSYTDTADTSWSCQLEVILEAAVVETQAVTMHADLIPKVGLDAANCDPRFGFAYRTMLQTGTNADDDLADYSQYYLVHFPQCANWNTENFYEQLYANSTMLNRGSHNFFNCYPNQISDTLGKLWWDYSPQVTTFTFGFRDLGSTYQDLIIPYATLPSTAVNGYLTLGQYATVTWYVVKALAVPAQAPLHFIAPTRDLFTNQFFDTVKKIQQKGAGLSQTGFTPTFAAKIYTRPDTLSGWTVTDLLPTIEAKVTAEGNTIDASTFHIDPVGVL